MADFQGLRSWIESSAPGVTVAAGNISAVKADFELGREMDLAGIDYAISMAFPLPSDALAGIDRAPTLLYKHLYSQVNFLMDRVALGVVMRLEQAGERAVAIPASQIIDWERLLAHVSHRQVAIHLGQGWWGRNNLCVTPARGAHVRLVTVLTSARIDAPGPWAGRGSGCGECDKCRLQCPAGAIGAGPGEFNREACSQLLRSFEKMRGIGQRICGVCVRACAGPKAT